MNTPETAIDLWQMYELDKTRQIPCNTLGTFYNLLISVGTHSINVGSTNTTEGTAEISLYGPITDDEGRLLAVYDLRREILHDPMIGLTEDQFMHFTKILTEKLTGSPLTVLVNALRLNSRA